MVVDLNYLKMDLDFKHLKKIKSSWFKHSLYASYFNFLAIIIFITGLIHSVLPCIFTFIPYILAKKICNGTEKKFGSNFKNRN